MKVGDLVRVDQCARSDKSGFPYGHGQLSPLATYPFEAMSGIVIEMVSNTRSWHNGGQKRDPVVLWESGIVSTVNHRRVINESR